MKFTFFIGCIWTLNFCHSQITLIPDSNFEQILINMGLDSGAPDGSIPTSAIDTVDYLYLTGYGISDLTGIEDFIALEQLTCQANPLSSIDLTNNVNLRVLFISHCDLTSLDLTNNVLLHHTNCSNNEIQSLDLSNNALLETFECHKNQIETLDFSGTPLIRYIDCSNNRLSELDVSQNQQLYWLRCNSNRLTRIDVSNCDTLQGLMCHDNELMCLNIQNGNNNNSVYPMQLDATNNMFLWCIQVDDPIWADAYWNISSGDVDPDVSFSDYCPMCYAEINEVPVSSKEIVKVFNLMGQEVDAASNGVLIYWYSDGSMEKHVVVH